MSGTKEDAMIFIALGLAGIIVSASLSKARVKRSGVPREMWEYTAGTGIVPRWISMINLGSWLFVVIGILSLLL